MGRKKKDPNKVKKEPSVIITFSGGPRDGDTMCVANPPSPRFRLAFPEWCHYYRVDDTLVYEYNMDIPWRSVNALESFNERKNDNA